MSALFTDRVIRGWKWSKSRLEAGKNEKNSEFDLTNGKNVVNYNPVALEMPDSGSGGALEKNRKIFRIRFDKCGKRAIFHPHASLDPEGSGEAVLKKFEKN